MVKEGNYLLYNYCIMKQNQWLLNFSDAEKEILNKIIETFNSQMKEWYANNLDDKIPDDIIKDRLRNHEPFSTYTDTKHGNKPRFSIINKLYSIPAKLDKEDTVEHFIQDCEHSDWKIVADGACDKFNLPKQKAELQKNWETQIKSIRSFLTKALSDNVEYSQEVER